MLIILRTKHHVGIYKHYLKSEKYRKVSMATPSPITLGRALLNSEIQVGEQPRNDDVLLSGVDCYFG